jgi:hypothetical protein
MAKSKQPKWVTPFLETFRENGNIKAAAKAANVNRSTVYDRKQSNADFAALFAEAEADAVDTLEEEAYRRAVTGTQEPVYYQGEVCGHVTRYSDTLLIVLLKARAPEKYRENAKVEHSGSVSQQIEIVEVVMTEGSDAGKSADEALPDGEKWEPIEI